MATGTSQPRGGRSVETMIRVAAPLLDLLLAAADRLSRVLEPEDPGYVPARMCHDGEAAPRGLRPRSSRPRL